MQNVAYLYLQSQIHVHPSQAVTPGQTVQVTLRNQLPAATGDNKYTEEMVPGYTGKTLSTMHYDYGRCSKISLVIKA